MRFKPSVWDDSDPLYAPCQKKIRNGFWWIPPKRYIDGGYTLKTYKLDPEEDDLERARHCRELTREMLRWWEGQTKGRTPNTWGWLIARYMTDEFSGIWDVRPHTREQYKRELARIEDAIGNVLITDTGFERMATWRRTMQQKGRSVHYIKKWFTHFGLVVSHGIKLEIDHCAKVKAIRGEMRLKTPGSRTVYMESQHVTKLVEAADASGQGYVALALLFRFEFILRGTDVYGVWEPAEGRKGGIQFQGRLWDGGLTWEMFDRDLTRFEKVISKTRDSLPEAYTFDLTLTPMLRQRLLAVPIEQRVGPVIVHPDTRRPPSNGEISRSFRKLRDAAGLPKDLQIRDARSGGSTEAKELVNPNILRDAMQHRHQATTDGYLRGRSTSANTVVQLRQAKRNG